MKRKLLRIAAVTALIFSYFNFSVTAFAASGGACVTDSDHSFTTGFVGSEGSRNGAMAKIDPAGYYFYPCAEIGQSSGVSAWVGVEMGPGGPQTVSPAIIQVGIVQCDNIIFTQPTYCDGDATHPHYFAAVGGCAPNGLTVDLGYADMGPHFYRIERHVAGGDWYLYIDDVLEWQVSTNHPMIFCWDEDLHRQNVISAEKFNRGDSLGTSGDRLHFTQMSFMNGLTWSPQNTGGCAAQPSSGIGTTYCDRSVNGLMSVYSVY